MRQKIPPPRKIDQPAIFIYRSQSWLSLSVPRCVFRPFLLLFFLEAKKHSTIFNGTLFKYSVAFIINFFIIDERSEI